MYLDANKLANVRRDVITSKGLTDAEIIIKDKFRTARNKKVKPLADNTETELEDDEIFLSFDSEDKAVVLKDCKVIVEDVVGNKGTVNIKSPIK